MKTVSIISTGNELLYGAVIDTNSAYISRALFPTDFIISRHLTVADSSADLADAVEFCLASSKVVIISGGLGPTEDDLTIEALHKLYNFNIVIDESALNKMRDVFGNMGRSVDEADIKMVSIPGNSIIIKNNLGLAPGFILEVEDKSIIALPGVPREIEGMFVEGVMPYLYNRYGMREKKFISMTIAGLKESEINAKIKRIKSIDGSFHWGMTARSGLVSIILVEKIDGAAGDNTIYGEFSNIFEDNLLLNGFTKPEEEIVYLLQRHNLTLATAESCTGGMIAERITDIPGSSRVFKGSVVAYNNDIKSRILHVPDKLLQDFGAVSQPVAGSMVRMITEHLTADIGVSVSGIAGPDGGTEEKPVGTVCFGFYFYGDLQTETKFYPGDRERVRLFSSLYSLERIRRYLRTL